jgi:hypothetical protein
MPSRRTVLRLMAAAALAPKRVVAQGAGNSPTVWILGDSNSVGAGNALVQMSDPGWTIVNHAISSRSSVGGLADAQHFLATETAPDIAIVTYGGVDVLEAKDAMRTDGPVVAQEILGRLLQIAELFQAAGSICILGKSIGCLTTQHPDDPTPLTSDQTFTLMYLDCGYVFLGNALDGSGYAPLVNLRLGKGPIYWDPEHFYFGYYHASPLGYQVAAQRMRDAIRAVA